VFSGKDNLHWQWPDVRILVETAILEPLDAQAVRSQLKHSSNYPDVSELETQIYNITGGIPSAVAEMVTQIDVLKQDGHRIDPDRFAEYESRLSHTLVQAMSRVFPEELVEVFYVLAMLRRFDPGLLSCLLPTTLTTFSNYSDNAYGALITELNTASLIKWNMQRKGYSVNLALRQILGTYIRLQHACRYDHINLSALNEYKNRISHGVGRLSTNILEALYHESCLNKAKGERFVLESSMKDYLAQAMHNYDQNQQVWKLQELSEELDFEWHAPDGLAELIPATQMASLDAAIKSHQVRFTRSSQKRTHY
jgi:hypothetical protein